MSRNLERKSEQSPSLMTRLSTFSRRIAVLSALAAVPYGCSAAPKIQMVTLAEGEWYRAIKNIEANNEGYASNKGVIVAARKENMESQDFTAQFEFKAKEQKNGLWVFFYREKTASSNLLKPAESSGEANDAATRESANKGRRGGVAVRSIGPRGAGTGETITPSKPDTTAKRNKRNAEDRALTVSIFGDNRKKERRVKLDVSEAMLEESQIDAATLKRLMRINEKAFQACHESALRSDPNMKGKIVIELTINKKGKVSKTKVRKNTTGNKAVSSCLAGRMKKWRFPEQAETTTAILPFIF